MSDVRKKKSGVFVWAVMGFLILGLGGFGLTGAFQTTGGSTVATVGDEEISADRFLSGFQQDISRASQQFGEPISMSQAQLFGIDQSSLRRQVTLAALSNEATRLNLSVGDAAVRDALLASPAFQITGGVFSEATYDLVLQQQRLTRSEYENLLRVDQTQNIINTAISGSIGPQTTATRVLMDYIGETRTLTWAEITPETLPNALSEVDEATARAFYAANPDTFTIPETRKLTYVIISPEILAKSIEVPEADIRALFDQRQEVLSTPAQRIADRIIFANMEDAAAAMARITSGEASFADIAAERGLTLEQASIGIIRATQLSTAAADMVFGTEETGVYGPVDDTLGAAIFNVNAAIPANAVAYDEVKDQFRDEIALGQAQTLLASKLGHIEDLIAGGVALEDIAAETEMELRQFDLNANTEAELALDPGFFTEAYVAETGEERDLVELPNDTIVALRVDEITPPRLQPYEEVAAEATQAATTAANLEAAIAYTEELKAQVEAGADLKATLQAIGITPNIAPTVTRTNTPTALPPSIGQDIFTLDANAVATFPSENGAYIIRVDNVSAFDADSENGQGFLAQAEAQIESDIADDIYFLFANGIVSGTDITINQGMINQILASIPQ